jgi:hypothetical protein
VRFAICSVFNTAATFEQLYYPLISCASRFLEQQFVPAIIEPLQEIECLIRGEGKRRGLIPSPPLPLYTL